MKLTKVHKFILFALGLFYQECNKQFGGAPLELAMSKSAFIDLAMKSRITEKKERALYKNLKFLEKKKLISYYNKNLRLTQRGRKAYEKVYAELRPYLNVAWILKSSDILHYTPKVRTVLKN